MRIIIYLLILVIIFGCSSSSTSNKETIEIIPIEDTQDFKISEAKVVLKLPKSYIPLTLSDYRELMLNSGYEEHHQERAIAHFERNELLFPETTNLVDTLNSSNTILINRKMEYVDLNQGTAQMIVNAFAYMDPVDGEIVTNRKITEQKFINGKKFRYVKIKIKLEGISGTTYKTVYVVSTNARSFLVIFNSLLDEDFQAYINALQVLQDK